MNFTDINQKMQALKSVDHFDSDSQLYIDNFPKGKLAHQIAKANRFTTTDLSGRIIYELLKGGIQEEEIIANREGTVITTARRITTEKAPAPTKNLKKEKYPNIDWDNTEDDNVQACMILFNDAVTYHNKMMDAQSKLDKNPEKWAPKIVEYQERNLSAYAELQSFNDNNTFLFEHPILKEKKQFAELLDLKETDTDAFMKRQKTAQDSILRYKNQLKNKAYKSEEEKANWEKLLSDYEDELDMIKKVIRSGKSGNFFKIFK